MSWRVTGTYLEACNCDPPCPCRTINGVRGDRSTHGICVGALSWSIDEGRSDGVDLGGLRVILVLRYSDDEAGSPWSYVLFVDARGDDRQRLALSDIFTGRRAGTAVDHFPWAWKASNLLAVRPAELEIDHRPGKGWFRSNGSVDVRIARPYEGDVTVTCVIPGHDRQGREVVAESIRVADELLEFEFSGVCGYESTFDYQST